MTGNIVVKRPASVRVHSTRDANQDGLAARGTRPENLNFVGMIKGSRLAYRPETQAVLRNDPARLPEVSLDGNPGKGALGRAMRANLQRREAACRQSQPERSRLLPLKGDLDRGPSVNCKHVDHVRNARDVNLSNVAPAGARDAGQNDDSSALVRVESDGAAALPGHGDQVERQLPQATASPLDCSALLGGRYPNSVVGEL